MSEPSSSPEQTSAYTPPYWMQYLIIFGVAALAAGYLIAGSMTRLTIATGGGLVFVTGAMAWYAVVYGESPLESDAINTVLKWYLVVMVVITIASVFGNPPG